jgi:serine-type D-Ala-D-Ala carboxypeptidase/endopeptidase
MKIPMTGLMKGLTILSLVAVTAACGREDAPPPVVKSALEAKVEQRLLGDRTGACLAVAVIDQSVARAFVCADPASARLIDGRTAFEIGSVTKTMTGALLADLVGQGKLALDDTLAQHLPPGSAVPAFGQTPIRLVHLVTHTSGLPGLTSALVREGLDNPYAALTEGALLEALATAQLQSIPGTRWEYSNFAVMLLSYVITRVAGEDLESLFRRRLFEPLGMQQAFIARKPAGVSVAQGHQSTGKPAGPWDFPVNLAGVGGVRASLDDMVRYAGAQLGRLEGADGATLALLLATQQPVPLGGPGHDGPEMGMGWVRIPLGGRTMVAHDGGTGGFSSFVGIDPDRGRAVVLLVDTGLSHLGGLNDLGLHLLESSYPLEEPRRLAIPSAELLASLVGHYRLDGGLEIVLSSRDGKLFALVAGEPEMELGFDSRGDFFPLERDALLTPTHAPGGGRGFTLTVGGGTSTARRLDPPASTTPPPTAAELEDYRGVYLLLPGFSITVVPGAGRLEVQATGQGVVLFEPAIKDVFVAPAVGAELTFEREASGRVNAVTLRQAGSVLRGQRQ